MGTRRSSVGVLLGRLVKGLVAAVLFPLVAGLFLGLREQVDLVSLSGSTFRHWIETGVVTYVVLHILLYRPLGLFRVGRQLFSALAAWLFGGQVASVDGAGGGRSPSEKRGGKGEASVQGSTLVAFSPYTVPLYTVLVCVAGWLAARGLDRSVVDGPVSFFIGATLAFHWLMTADELQAQRARWHVETYLLAIELVFLLTLLVVAACLPLAVPGFSFIGALAEALARAQAIFTTVLHQLFL